MTSTQVGERGFNRNADIGRRFPNKDILSDISESNLNFECTLLGCTLTIFCFYFADADVVLFYSN